MGFRKKLFNRDERVSPSDKDSTDARAAQHYRNGRSLHMQGDKLGAIQEFERALKLGGKDPALLLSLGDCYTQSIHGADVKAQRRYAEEAIKCYERFLIYGQPQLADRYWFYVNLATCYGVKSIHTRRLVDAESAEKALRAAEKVRPGDAVIREKREWLADLRIKFSYY